MSDTLLFGIGAIVFLVTTTATFLVVLLNADVWTRSQSDVYQHANTPPIDLGAATAESARSTP